MASDPRKLQAHLEAAVPDMALTFKPMFGGILAYADGKPLASLSNVGLALKLADSDQDELLRVKGAKRLQYEPDQPPSKTYIVVPLSVMNDRGKLHSWVARAAAGAASKALKRATRRAKP